MGRPGSAGGASSLVTGAFGPGALRTRHTTICDMSSACAHEGQPTLLVLVHETDGLEDLVWAVHEAGRRGAVVLAVALLDSGAAQGRRDRALAALEAQVLRVVGLTGVHGRTRTALLDPLVYEALGATVRGGDFVVVRPQGKVVLRPAARRRAPRAVARAVGVA